MAVTDYTTTRLDTSAGGSDTCASAANELALNGTDPRNFSVYGDSAEGAVVDRAPAQGQGMEDNGALNAKISKEHKDIGTAPCSVGVVNADTIPLDDRGNVRPPTDVTSQVRGPGIESDVCQASSTGRESPFGSKGITFSSSQKDRARSATKARSRSPKKRGCKTTRANRNKSPVETTSACEEVRAASSAYEEAATAVEKAEEAVRKRKGKGKEMELPTSESASTGSKRGHDDETTVDDVTELPLGPGSSRPVTRRTRACIQDPSASPQPTRRSTRIPELVAQGKIKTSQVAPPAARVMHSRPVRQAQNAKRKCNTDGDGDEALEVPQQSKKQRLAAHESQESHANRSQDAQRTSSCVPSQCNTTPPVDAIRVKLRDHEKDIRLSAIRYTLRFRRWTDPLEDVIEIEGVTSNDVPNNREVESTRSESQASSSNEATIKGTVPTSPGARHASPSSEDEVETLLLAQDGRESTPTAGSPGPSTLPRSTANIPEDAVVIDLTGDTPVELTRPRQKVRRGPRGGQWKCQWPQNNTRWYHSPPPDETGRQRLAPEPSDGLVEAMRNGWTYGCRSPAYSRYTKYKIW